MVIFIDTGKPTREQIKEQLLNSQITVYDDENAFLWHLIRKVLDRLNELYEENQSLNKTNKVLYDENIQLREKLLHFMNLKDDVKYLEEKGVF